MPHSSPDRPADDPPRASEGSGTGARGQGPPTDRLGRLARPPLRVWVHALIALFVWGVAIAAFLAYPTAVELIVLGFIATCAVASALHPVARRIPLPRGVSAVLTGLGFILVVAGVLALLSWLLVDPIQVQVRQWDQTRDSLNGLLAQVSARIGLGQDERLTVETILERIRGFFTGGRGGQIVTRAADLVTHVGIVLAFLFIGSIYMLAESHRSILRPVLAIVPPGRRAAVRGIVHDLEPRLRWWLVGTLISMSIIGVASWIGYTIIGLPFAIPLALLAGLAETVPTVGPLTAFVIALLVAATQGTTEVIGVAVLYAVIQTLESYVILPLVMRRAVSLPPIVTLFTIVLWGTIFGLPGLLLAVPIDLTIWTVVDHMVIRARAPALLTTDGTG